ncbi:NAD(P)-dependent dehydrogenase (short-subunit alcohol dehydrogenase family) [Novosphingobium sp. 1529]|uniref:SDR family NAD(P)-dependent oxidoreductase n=1 Tax=Novosphingobium sp. 1529 TaxID=3156424 RepID=UPI001494B4F0
MKIQSVAAIVTGGASGLGAATAEMLAARGAKVTLFDLNRDLGTALAQQIGGHFAAVDVSDSAAVAQALEEAEAAHGVARILVNCAGTGIPAKTVDRHGQAHALDAFERVIRINLAGTFNVLSKFAARLSAAPVDEEERGVIVNTASVAAYDGQIGQAAYSASKGGIVGMTLPVARDLAQFGIRVNTIAPGLFLTPLLHGLSDEAKRSLEAQVPFPSRLGQPPEYAQLVEAIIGNPMLNGEVIRLDGAIRMAPR